MITQLIFVLVAIVVGARLGGIGLKVAGGLGLAVLTFGFGLMPTSAPIDVILMIAAVIAADKDVEYMTLLLKLNYNITPSWNVFAKGMYETAASGNSAKWFDGEMTRKSYGYYAGVEYYPLRDSNLHFFLTYVGRSYKMMSEDFTNSNHKVLLGFIYQLTMF